MPPIITCAAALNSCFNVSGVELLIESITIDLECFDDDFATKAKNISTNLWKWWGEGDDVGAAGGCSGSVRRWLRRWEMVLVVLMIYGSVWRWRSIVVCQLSWPDVGGGAESLAEKRRGAENDI
ncbi:hypothetical protein Tco_0874538 [Tanacetum coccineum]|uniref:Uncharacterized protein n=1 Tax=Tanacetum coccineum TaxID=301880 RepID=A0ABQ5BPR2_9ASTR